MTQPPFPRRLQWFWLVLPLFPIASAAAPADNPQITKREITAAELVKLGFFEDFAELNLEDLLGAGEIQTSIASGTDTAVGDAPGSVLVITAEEIRDIGARTLEDVLRTLPGFDLRTDSLGRRRVVVRGMAPESTGSEGVLVLFNGHPLNEHITGGATTVNLDFALGDVARIEILRGPGSSLYGNGALAAVINIQTSAVTDFAGIGLEAGFGSFSERRGMFRVGNKLWGVSVSGFVHFLDYGDVKLAIPADTQPPSLTETPGNTRDSRRNLETAYRVSFKDLVLGIRFKNETAGGFIGYSDSLGTQNDLNNRQLTLDLSYRRSLGADTVLRGTLRYANDEIRELLEVLPPGYEQPMPDGGTRLFSGGVFLQAFMNEKRYGAEVAVDRKQGGRHQLRADAGFERSATYGLEANGNLDFRTMTPHDDLVPLPGLLPESSRDIVHIAAQDIWAVSSRVTLTGGLRLDHGSDFGDQWSPRLAMVAVLPRDFGFKLGYARGFRAPSFREQFFYFPGATPNPDLAPTVSDGAEAIVTWKAKNLSLTAGAYAAWIRDPIGPDAFPAPLNSANIVNLPDYRVRGLEIELRRNLGVNDVAFLNYTHQVSEDEQTKQGRPEIPADLATLGATFRVRERLVVTPLVLMRGKRSRAPGDPRDPLPGYAIVNLHLRVPKLVRTLELQATVENLFGTRYFDPARAGGVPGDYPRPGRGVFFAAAYRF